MIRSTDDTPMTVLERYASALASSNLRMQERHGDLDVIIAAGCLDESFAAAMVRLRIEYDMIRGEHRIADNQLRAAEANAKRQKDKMGADGKLIPGPAGADGKPTTAVQRAEKILEDAEKAAHQAHAMILLSMSTLRLAKEMMGYFALREAARHKFERPVSHILHLSGHVLDVHIDMTCRACRGRGFNGNLAKGERQAPCRPCRGLGTRRDSIGKDEHDRLFAGRLLMEMDALVAEGERQLQQKRRETMETKALITEAEAMAMRG